MNPAVDVSTSAASWPPLPLEAWQPTKETLHRYCQMIGKVHLALHPFRVHWWHMTLRLDTTGFTTGPMPVGDARMAEVRLALVDHACEVRGRPRLRGARQHWPDEAVLPADGAGVRGLP